MQIPQTSEAIADTHAFFSYDMQKLTCIGSYV